MNTPLQTNTSRSSSASVNPFARALAEARGASHGSDNFANNPLNPHSSAAGNNGALNEFGGADSFEQQQRMIDQQKELQKKEQLRQKLHRQINPVEQTDVFNAREAQVKKEIDNLRHELKLLVQEIKEFHTEIEIAVLSNVASPGQEGKYHLTFFQKLREFILLLRNQVHSARTWMTTFQSKKKKKSRGGMLIENGGHQETKSVWDRMNNERSSLYSGG
jgi:hypothetical protein